MARKILALLCLVLVFVAARIGFSEKSQDEISFGNWDQVLPGLLQTKQAPYGYALVDNGRALLIDAPTNDSGLEKFGAKKIDKVLLTHHHRDSCAALNQYLKAGTPVLAPEKSQPWLEKTKVKQFWLKNIPLRNSRTAYFVVPVGYKGIDFSIKPNQTFQWQNWNFRVIPTPGHSKDHVAYAAWKGKENTWIVFSGDAIAAPGKMWAPFTTDWDHWTDAGQKPAAESLLRILKLKPKMILPAHGKILNGNPPQPAQQALQLTINNIREAGFLKSFERFSKQRLGNAPAYQFLAKEQAPSNGSLPWSQLSKNLYVTGNTFVLTSKTKDFLVVDPWGERSAKQIAKLKKDQKLKNLEVVFFSHAHYDHFDGIYHLPDRNSFKTWMLDRISHLLSDPNQLRAPFLDPRPIRIDERPKPGDTLTWREYSFRFHHLPGQSGFSMGVETKIDGKKCFFTADNFFHQDMYSGSGGWMGLNWTSPLFYSASAAKVLKAGPDWVLAEHGGPFEFNREDFRRRVLWGKAAANAMDRLCYCGNHRLGWNPHWIHVVPHLQKAKPGEKISFRIEIHNETSLKRTLKLGLQTDLVKQPTGINKNVEIPGPGFVMLEESLQIPPNTPPGRYVVAMTGTEQADAFFAIDIEN